MFLRSLSKVLLAVGVLILVGANAASVAAETSAAAKPAGEQAKLAAALAAKLPGVKPEDVRPTPIPGIFQVSVGAHILHVTGDAKYLIAGDLYDLSTNTNLTDKTRNQRRARALASINDNDAIVFGPAAAKYTITVFTDTDCAYCRRLHSQIAEINKLGVRVRYVAYPRGGPGSPSWHTMESVWCAKDRRDALTRAKLGEPILPAKCGITPVAAQYRLGQTMGVDGTPAIFTESGELIGGYHPPRELLAYVKEAVSSDGAVKAK